MSDVEGGGNCARIDIPNAVPKVEGSTFMVCHGLIRKRYSP